MFYNLAHATHVGGAGGGIGVNNAESEVGLEESVHHHPIPEFEDLEGEDSAGKENQWERKERQLDNIVCG